MNWDSMKWDIKNSGIADGSSSYDKVCNCIQQDPEGALLFIDSCLADVQVTNSSKRVLLELLESDDFTIKYGDLVNEVMKRFIHTKIESVSSNASILIDAFRVFGLSTNHSRISDMASYIDSSQPYLSQQAFGAIVLSCSRHPSTTPDEDYSLLRDSIVQFLEAELTNQQEPPTRRLGYFVNGIRALISLADNRASTLCHDYSMKLPVLSKKLVERMLMDYKELISIDRSLNTKLYSLQIDVYDSVMRKLPARHFTETNEISR